jgi:hypothetical protein
MLERYGAWTEKSMYGRSYMGIDRATFLIDREGTRPPHLAEGEGARARRDCPRSRQGYRLTPDKYWRSRFVPCGILKSGLNVAGARPSAALAR